MGTLRVDLKNLIADNPEKSPYELAKQIATLLYDRIPEARDALLSGDAVLANYVEQLESERKLRLENPEKVVFNGIRSSIERAADELLPVERAQRLQAFWASFRTSRPIQSEAGKLSQAERSVMTLVNAVYVLSLYAEGAKLKDIALYVASWDDPDRAGVSYQRVTQMANRGSWVLHRSTKQAFPIELRELRVDIDRTYACIHQALLASGNFKKLEANESSNMSAVLSLRGTEVLKGQARRMSPSP